MGCIVRVDFSFDIVIKFSRLLREKELIPTAQSAFCLVAFEVWLCEFRSKYDDIFLQLFLFCYV